jgi:hypothetical protein
MNYSHSAKGAHYLLSFLSLFRYASPLIGFTFFSIEGFVLGLLLSVYLHHLIKNYMGLNLFGAKKIGNKSEFVPLKDWMVPGGRDLLSAAGINDLNESSTKYAKPYTSQSLDLTNYDFANACLFHQQLGKYLKLEDERLLAKEKYSVNES